EHEGQVDERGGALALEQRPHPRPVTDVELRERDLGVERSRRPDVGDHDALGVVALDHPVDETASDVAGAAGHHVAHWRILHAGVRTAGTEKGPRRAPCLAPHTGSRGECEPPYDLPVYGVPPPPPPELCWCSFCETH